jgi:hypothetical protein
MLILRNSMLVDSNPLSSITRFCYFVSCFDMNATRWVFAIFIFLSFCCNVIQTQALKSPGTKLYKVLRAFEVGLVCAVRLCTYARTQACTARLVPQQQASMSASPKP